MGSELCVSVTMSDDEREDIEKRAEDIQDLTGIPYLRVLTKYGLRAWNEWIRWNEDSDPVFEAKNALKDTLVHDFERSLVGSWRSGKFVDYDLSRVRRGIIHALASSFAPQVLPVDSVDRGLHIARVAPTDFGSLTRPGRVRVACPAFLPGIAACLASLRTSWHAPINADFHTQPFGYQLMQAIAHGELFDILVTSDASMVYRRERDACPALQLFEPLIHVHSRQQSILTVEQPTCYSTGKLLCVSGSAGELQVRGNGLLKLGELAEAERSVCDSMSEIVTQLDEGVSFSEHCAPGWTKRARGFKVNPPGERIPHTISIYVRRDFKDEAAYWIPTFVSQFKSTWLDFQANPDNALERLLCLPGYLERFMEGRRIVRWAA